MQLTGHKDESCRETSSVLPPIQHHDDAHWIVFFCIALFCHIFPTTPGRPLCMAPTPWRNSTTYYYDCRLTALFTSPPSPLSLSQDQSELNSTVIRSPTNTVVIRGLKPGSIYVFQVRARTVAGFGRYSGKLYFQTMTEGENSAGVGAGTQRRNHLPLGVGLEICCGRGGRRLVTVTPGGSA